MLGQWLTRCSLTDSSASPGTAGGTRGRKRARRISTILDLARSVLERGPPSSTAGTTAALAPAVWSGCRRLLDACFTTAAATTATGAAMNTPTPVFAHDISLDPDLEHARHTFLTGCAQLLFLPPTLPKAASHVVVDPGAVAAALDLPEAIRVQRSEAILLLSRAVVAQLSAAEGASEAVAQGQGPGNGNGTGSNGRAGAEACCPRCRDYPLAQHVARLSTLQAAEHSHQVRANLGVALDLLQHLHH